MAPKALWVLALVLAGAASGGCVSSGVAPAGMSAGEKDGLARPTVVALIDTGITPYHEAFLARPGGVRVDDHLDLVPGAELASPGSSSSYERGKLYAFSGTRVLAIALKNASGAAPILDGSNHGTGAASLVAREDPDALIVMVQVESSGCGAPPQDCPVYPPLAEGMAWAARQPWIDVISVSMAPPGNVPTAPTLDEARRYLAASRLAHDQGKILVASAGNQAVPSLAQYVAGPPWVVAVGGFLPGSRGEATFASKGVDVVANFTDTVASSDQGMRVASGTSFAAPIVAGVLSRALHEARAALHHRGGITAEGALAAGPDALGATARLTSKDFRDALNATAARVAATDWDPTRPSSNETSGLPDRGLPILAPPLQTGWGYVHGGLAPEITAWVLSSDRTLPDSNAATAQTQAARQAARETYWGAAVGS